MGNFGGSPNIDQLGLCNSTTVIYTLEEYVAIKKIYSRLICPNKEDVQNLSSC